MPADIMAGLKLTTSILKYLQLINWFNSNGNQWLRKL